MQVTFFILNLWQYLYTYLRWFSMWFLIVYFISTSFFLLLYLIFRKNVCKVANFRVFKCRSTIFLKYKHFDFYHFVRWFSNIYIPQNVVSYSNFYFYKYTYFTLLATIINSIYIFINSFFTIFHYPLLIDEHWKNIQGPVYF